MRRRYFFIIPFFVSLLAFVAINVASYFMASDPGPVGFESSAVGGFPYPWYTRNWIGDPPVDKVGLGVDLVVALIASYAIGKIIQWVFVTRIRSAVKSLDG